MKTRRAAYLFNSFTFLAADWIWLDWRRNPPIKMQQVPPVEAYRSGGTGLFVCLLRILYGFLLRQGLYDSARVHRYAFVGEITLTLDDPFFICQ